MKHRHSKLKQINNRRPTRGTIYGGSYAWTAREGGGETVHGGTVHGGTPHGILRYIVKKRIHKLIKRMLTNSLTLDEAVKLESGIPSFRPLSMG